MGERAQRGYEEGEAAFGQRRPARIVSVVSVAVAAILIALTFFPSLIVEGVEWLVAVQ